MGDEKVYYVRNFFSGVCVWVDRPSCAVFYMLCGFVRVCLERSACASYRQTDLDITNVFNLWLISMRAAADVNEEVLCGYFVSVVGPLPLRVRFGYDAV